MEVALSPNFLKFYHFLNLYAKLELMFKKVLFPFIILINLVFFLNPALVFAADPKSCSTAGVGPSQEPDFIPEGAPEVKFSFHNLPKNQNFYWKAKASWDKGMGYQSKVAEKSNDDGKLTISITEPELLTYNGKYWVELWQSGSSEAFCGDIKYTVGYQFDYDTCQIDAPNTVTINQDIIVNISNAPQFPPNTIRDKTGWEWPVYFGNQFITKVKVGPDGTANFIIEGFKTTTSRELYLGRPGRPIIDPDRFCRIPINVISSTSSPTPTCKISPSNQTIISDITINAVNLPKNENFFPKLSLDGTPVLGLIGRNSGSEGRVQLMLVKKGGAVGNYKITVVNSKDEKVNGCEQSFSLGLPPTPLKIIEKCEDPGVKCSTSGGKECEDKKDGRGPAMKTAIGCIHTSPVEFVKDFLKFIVAISGGFAFLMMLLGTYQMLTSAGNPDSLNAGRERLTSAIIGLLFVIFAVLLMQIIGVDILKIPGFFK